MYISTSLIPGRHSITLVSQPACRGKVTSPHTSDRYVRVCPLFIIIRLLAHGVRTAQIISLILPPEYQIIYVVTPDGRLSGERRCGSEAFIKERSSAQGHIPMVTPPSVQPASSKYRVLVTDWVASGIQAARAAQDRNHVEAAANSQH